MIGAIIGDVVGSRFEFNNIKTKEFKLITDECEFTDDTVLTIALMDWGLHAKVRDSYSVVEYLQRWARKYPNSGFGGRFSREWLWNDNPKPYNSKGNGSGMRVSPIAYIARSKDELLWLSDLVTSVTHNHREGLRGARAIAYATFMALRGDSKEEIKQMAISIYPQIENFTYEELIKNYQFNELAETTCPQALYCFLISNSFEDCLRTSISIGGDSDTLCAMSCAIAEAYYKDIPTQLIKDTLNKLPEDMKNIIAEFYQRYEGNGEINPLYPYCLDRFVKAQEHSYEVAKHELMNGSKDSHWMWYIFPQLKGLGKSETSYQYGINGLGEAKAYFEHAVLGPRLIELCNVLLNLNTNNPNEVFGDLDAKKLQSSMTLFYGATKNDLFKKVINKYFEGKLDDLTLRLVTI